MEFALKESISTFSWEAFWVLFSIVGVLCIPHIWAAIEVPHYMTYVLATPTKTLCLGALAGFSLGSQLNLVQQSH
ncbi:MAG: hypothetical protein ACLS54_05485 [Anaerostipes hadrus]